MYLEEEINSSTHDKQFFNNEFKHKNSIASAYQLLVYRGIIYMQDNNLTKRSFNQEEPTLTFIGHSLIASSASVKARL